MPAGITLFNIELDIIVSVIKKEKQSVRNLRGKNLIIIADNIIVYKQLTCKL